MGCNAAEESAMKRKGSGNKDGTFPKIASNCGTASYSLFSGMDQSGFGGCITRDVPGVSPQCAQCFAEQASYAADNCKMQCISAWCSSACLSCNNQNHAVLVACTKTSDLPTTEPCDR